MKSILTLTIVGLMAIVMIGCNKEEPLTPAQMLEGQWTIDSQEILTVVAPGDGSYLTFNACSSTCDGVDFKASDTTTGSFTYTLNEEGTLLTINDGSSDGGNWDATWDVLELTENSLRITATTIFGNMLVELSK